MYEFEKELKLLDVKEEYIKQLIQIQKTESVQRELIEDLKKLKNKETINKTIEKIIELSKKPEELQDIDAEPKIKGREALEKPKFHEVRKRAEIILDEAHKVVCLKGEPKYREISEEFDRRKDCIGEANYVCHHCGRNLCSQHSYWIPDNEFPYITKKIEEGKYEKDPKKLKAARRIINLSIFILIIGIILTMTGLFNFSMILVSVVFYIIGGGLLIYGVILYRKPEEFVGRFYPSFIRRRSTKWNRDILDVYEHKGYYTAVHCWECFKKFHSKINETAEKNVDISICTKQYICNIIII